MSIKAVINTTMDHMPERCSVCDLMYKKVHYYHGDPSIIARYCSVLGCELEYDEIHYHRPRLCPLVEFTI